MPLTCPETALFPVLSSPQGIERNHIYGLIKKRVRNTGTTTAASPSSGDTSAALEPSRAAMNYASRTAKEELLQKVTTKAFNQILNDKDGFIRQMQENIT